MRTGALAIALLVAAAMPAHADEIYMNHGFGATTGMDGRLDPVFDPALAYDLWFGLRRGWFAVEASMMVASETGSAPGVMYALISPGVGARAFVRVRHRVELFARAALTYNFLDGEYARVGEPTPIDGWRGAGSNAGLGMMWSITEGYGRGSKRRVGLYLDVGGAAMRLSGNAGKPAYTQIGTVILGFVVGVDP